MEKVLLMKHHLELFEKENLTEAERLARPMISSVALAYRNNNYWNMTFSISTDKIPGVFPLGITSYFMVYFPLHDCYVVRSVRTLCSPQCTQFLARIE